MPNKAYQFLGGFFPVKIYLKDIEYPNIYINFLKGDPGVRLRITVDAYLAKGDGKK